MKSSASWPSRRAFYVGLAVVCGLALTVAAAQANEASLVIGGLIVAVAVDGFESLSGTWVGWRRAVDSRRLIIFAAAFVFGVALLAGIAYVIANPLYLGD